MVHMKISQGSRRVEVVPGVAVQQDAIVTVTDYRGFDVTAVLSVSGGARVEVDSLTVARREGSKGVTGEGLRTIAVQSIVRQFVASEIRWGSTIPDGTYVVAWGLLETTEAQRMRKQGPTHETLGWVARIYRLAEFMEEAPTKAIEGSFEVSRSTAGAWIGRARSAGLIDPVTTEG